MTQNLLFPSCVWVKRSLKGVYIGLSVVIIVGYWIDTHAGIKLYKSIRISTRA